MKGGYRQACCTVELINIPPPKSTSSQSLCSVLEKLETILLNLRRSKFNGIWKTITSRIWIVLMENPKIYERTTVWTREFHGQDHLHHVNVWRHCMGCIRKWCLCVDNSKIIEEYAERILRGHWPLPAGSEKNWYRTYDCKLDGSWNPTAERMLQNLKKMRKDINTFPRQHAKHWVPSPVPSVSSVFTEQQRIWLMSYQLAGELRGNPLH